MKRLLLVGLVVVALLISASGCGGKATTTPQPTPEPPAGEDKAVYEHGAGSFSSSSRSMIPQSVKRMPL